MDIEDEEIESIITIDSKMIASKPSRMYITEENLIFGNDIVNRDKVVDINRITDNRWDKIGLSIILTNSIAGAILAYSIASGIVISVLITFLSGLLGYLVLRLVRDNPYSYISLETKNEEYQFGVLTPVDMAELFGAVYQNLDKEMTYESMRQK